MPAPAEISDLVARFEQQLDTYKSGNYNETQLRRDYLDPFFRSLGWDIDNTGGYAEAYRDVIHEDAIRIGGAVKAPDYCFRVGGTRKFFVEAKKPQVRVREEVPPAYQLRRYAWSAKLPLSILADFEEFAVYDCRIKPAPTDAASTARVFYGTFRDYAEKWDWIASIFSREAVLKGSFDKYAETNKAKRGTTEVDADFLASMETWRNELARNLALRNPALSTRELNFAVQRILDRIVFLRICEDRGLERYGRLLALVNGPRIYPRLGELFLQADTRYNSGLFHFKAEKGRNEPPDALTRGLDVDDKLLRDLLKGLYYPESPYEFSVLSADILGQVYEQFLGKVIRLTEGHRAVVEEKPEVRKAGGVYYTPTYIVDYIVRETVGNLLVDKTPKEAAKLRVLDPACGSGSFLIGAYQHLLDWHLAWYGTNEPEKWAKAKHPAIVPATARGAGPRNAGAGDWRLTIAERKRILLNNIHGVDIDAAAVEVTKLSLLLKVLEGETEQTVQTMFDFHHERALPDLGENIKCGNSLIGSDFYRQPKLPEMDDEERLRLNAFDWSGPDGFPEIMKAGGFDAVIGNPPYIRIQTLKETQPEAAGYLSQTYASAAKGNYDIYVVFVERGLQLLGKDGKLGFILPHKFFNAQYGGGLRKVIFDGNHLRGIVHFGHQQVFEGAATYTCLLFLGNRGTASFRFQHVSDLIAWRENPKLAGDILPAEGLKSPSWNFQTEKTTDVLDKVHLAHRTLGDIAIRMAQGIRTSANEVFVLDMVETRSKYVLGFSKQLQKNVELELELVSPFLLGREIKPFSIQPTGKILLIPYRTSGERMELIPENEFKTDFPRAWSYLCENRSHLESRERNRMKTKDWYGYVYPKNLELMRSPKILVPDIADRASFALDEKGSYSFTSGYCVTLRNDFHGSWKYILGVLNSHLLDFCLKRVSTSMRGGYFRYFTQFIEKLPVAIPNLSDPKDKAAHDQIVALVDRMLSLNKQLAAAKTPHEKTALERQIAATDTEIDRLVYQLYNLTEDEIRIVEGGTTR